MAGELSEILLQLYRGSRTQDAAKFQDWALELVKAAIPFDSAFWGSGVMAEAVPVVHAWHLHHQPAQMMADYERFKHLDVLAYILFKHPGTTINYPATEYPSREIRQRYLKIYGLQQILSTMLIDPATQLCTAISLYRSDALRPYTEAERGLKQQLMPHLVESCSNNRMAYCIHCCETGSRHCYVPALVDRQGVLNLADADFAQLLRTEWPNWRGPRLPEALIAFIATETGDTYVGHAIAIRLSKIDDLLLLRVRARAPYDCLGHREREVAERFAEGYTAKEIALMLNIAPATVSNHLEKVYLKLGVTSKAKLVRLLDDLR
jgi:DNA-binding CsgD family transcriptional regulator